MRSKRPFSFFNRLILPVEFISWATYLKVALGGILLAALSTQHPLDPSPLNLLVPANGIHNLLMMPGALIAGFLTDSLGLSAYTIPLSLLLFAKRDQTIKPLRFFPVSIAIIAFTTLLSLLISDTPETLLQITGIWGMNARATLVTFPGPIPSITVLSIYLIIFFKEIRIDSTPILMVSFLALLTLGVLKQFREVLTSTYQASSKYLNINWLTPGLSYFDKYFGKVQNSVLTKAEALKERLFEIRQSKQESTAKSQPSPSNFITPFDEDELLALTIHEYRKEFYPSDRRGFLVYEEEI